MKESIKTLLNGLRTACMSELGRLRAGLTQLKADTSASLTALGRRVTTAQTAAKTAQYAAESAQTAANTAQSTANSAQSTANSAQSTANSAQSTANSAQSAANSAQSTANTAKTTAESKANKSDPVFTGSFSQNRRSGTTIGANSHAEGYYTTASGYYSHAEGSSTTASGDGSHAEGSSTTASGDGSHAEGSSTTASGYYSHAEGSSTTASGDYSHAEGSSTTASGNHSHAEGYYTTASGDDSHAEGNGYRQSHGLSGEAGSKTYECANAHMIRPQMRAQFGGITAVVLSCDSTTVTLDRTLSDSSSIENQAVVFYSGAFGDDSHAEGSRTTASGYYSHAEGSSTTASGYYSHAEGYYTTAQRRSQHVQGEYNVLDTEGSETTRGKYAHIVGNGTRYTARSNAHTLDWAGVAWFQGRPQFGGTAQDNGSQTVMANGDTEIVLASSTAGSTKKFRLTVDDTGALTATEVE